MLGEQGKLHIVSRQKGVVSIGSGHSSLPSSIAACKAMASRVFNFLRILLSVARCGCSGMGEAMHGSIRVGPTLVVASVALSLGVVCICVTHV